MLTSVEAKSIGNPFPKMALLSRSNSQGREALFRYLCVDENFIYVMPVKIGSAPKNSCAPIKWEKREIFSLIGKNIISIPEVVCPTAMLEKAMSEKESLSISEKMNKIAWIVEHGDAVITDPILRAQLISEAAALFKIGRCRIRTLLTRHFYFGAHENALMNLNSFKGAPGVCRFDSTSKKMGRPNDSILLGEGKFLGGRNMTKWHMRILRQIVEEQFAFHKITTAEIYDRWLFKMVGVNR